MENPLFEPKFLNLEFFFNQILKFLQTVYDILVRYSGGAEFFQYLKAALSVLSILFITIIAYSVVRLWEIRKEEKEKHHFAEPVRKDGGEKRERWEVVEEHVRSDRPADWRLAIIEADTILEEMLKRMGYEGESLGERLKVVEPSDFTSIQSAWEAHKVRNQIAHEGSGFELSHREAKRIIGLYEQVFKEFEYI